MRKQILTGLGVLILGSSVAFASPQSLRSNFNDQPANQTQQQRQWNQRGAQQGTFDQRGNQQGQWNQRGNQQQRQVYQRASYQSNQRSRHSNSRRYHKKTRRDYGDSRR